MNAPQYSEPPSQIVRNFFIGCVAAFCFVLFLLVLFWPTTRAYLQAAAILTELNGGKVPRLLRPVAAMPVTERRISIPSASGIVSAWLYTPANRPAAPGLVLVPGIHYLGIDEPRLVAFARSLSACGLRVLTPDLPDSRDYRIGPGDVRTIGDSVGWLHGVTGHPVGLMGLSFAGGLALMAAAEPPSSNQVSFVFAVGAHDDLFRVASFYTTGADPLPNGDIEREKPNNYGPWILEYEHLEDFTQPADTAAIRAAFRARLYNDPALEKSLVAKLTPSQKIEYDQVVSPRDSPLSESNEKHAAEMAAVSPHGHLAGLHVPVYLLHGRQDDVIPFAESEWLAQDLPGGTLKALLISPLIVHVNTTKSQPSLRDRWRLIHLLAQVMQQAEHAR